MELVRDLMVINVLAKFENDPWKIMDVRVLTGLVCPAARPLGVRQYPGALKGCGVKRCNRRTDRLTDRQNQKCIWKCLQNVISLLPWRVIIWAVFHHMWPNMSHSRPSYNHRGPSIDKTISTWYPCHFLVGGTGPQEQISMIMMIESPKPQFHVSCTTIGWEVPPKYLHWQFWKT